MSKWYVFTWKAHLMFPQGTTPCFLHIFIYTLYGFEKHCWRSFQSDSIFLAQMRNILHPTPLQLTCSMGPHSFAFLEMLCSCWYQIKERERRLSIIMAIRPIFKYACVSFNWNRLLFMAISLPSRYIGSLIYAGNYR